MARIKRSFRFFRQRGFPFRFVYSDSYWMVNLRNHVFPIKKYRLIYEQLLKWGAKKEDFLPPHPASDESLLRIHTEKYVQKIRSGKLTHSELATLEIPFIPEGIDFALLNVGGTIKAAELALDEGLSFHLGGGFHHAFSDHGEGFCVFNDVAVAIEEMRKEKSVNKAIVVDCDVHQGNGTAAIFAQKDYAFTFSIHQMDLYPAEKPSSSLDVGLWSGDGDEKYLAALNQHFPRIFEEFKPDLVYFLAGADPYERDQLANLKLTKDGLMERDRIIIESARKLDLPLTVVLAGGYAYDIFDTVSIHVNTIKIATKIARKYPYLSPETGDAPRKKRISFFPRIKIPLRPRGKKSPQLSNQDTEENP
jgi:acetoin utilization deacetylase AcuC-like enzyme